MLKKAGQSLLGGLSWPLKQIARLLRWLGGKVLRLLLALFRPLWRALGWFGIRLRRLLTWLLWRPLLAVIRFIGRLGLAARNLYLMFIWRPLLPVFAFVRRVGLAARELFLLFVWQPFYIATTPLRWLYRKFMAPPLAWLWRYLGLLGLAERRLLHGFFWGLGAGLRWLFVHTFVALARYLRQRWRAGRPARVRLRRRLRSRWLVWQARARVRLQRREAPLQALLAPPVPVIAAPAARPGRLLATLVSINVVLVALSLLITQTDLSPTTEAAAVSRTPTATLTSTPTPTLTPELTTTPAPTVSPTPLLPTWTPWPTPDPLGTGGSLVFSMSTAGNEDIYALSLGRAEPIRLTGHPAADRSPRWSPDGNRIAFASDRSGNWEVYVLNLQTGRLQRLTNEPTYQGAPSWSPDGEWLIYESYETGNLDLFIMPADGSGFPIRLTEHTAPDYSPVWAPGGRHIAFTSWRSGNKDIYLMPLDAATDSNVINLTNTPDRAEDHAAFSPDGSLITYDDHSSGFDLVYVLPLRDYRPAADPLVVGQGRQPSFAPNGADIVYVHEDEIGQPYLIASSLDAWSVAPQAFSAASVMANPDWSAMILPADVTANLQTVALADADPLFVETFGPPPAEGPPHLLRQIPVEAPLPFLSDSVDDSFLALRERVIAETGWDFLGELDSLFAPIDAAPLPGQSDRTWDKAGRAFAFRQEMALVLNPRIEVVREDFGDKTYWRIYLRAELQDGSQGEPMRELPWDFRARFGPDPQFYDQGGRVRDYIPTGYYVDFTALAAAYGWNRVPAADNWRTFFPSIRYWQFENHGDSDWEQAMLELYTPEEILEEFAR